MFRGEHNTCPRKTHAETAADEVRFCVFNFAFELCGDGNRDAG